MSESVELQMAVESIADSLTAHDEHVGGEEKRNLADGLFAIAESLNGLAQALRDIDRSLTTPEVGAALEGLSRLGSSE